MDSVSGDDVEDNAVAIAQRIIEDMVSELVFQIGETGVETDKLITPDEIRAISDGFAALLDSTDHQVRHEDGKHKEDLGRFGHHPDPAIDFCVEVETIEGENFNTKIGFTNGTPTADELRERVDRAMSFRVGGDLNAIKAKHLLRTIEEEIRTSAEPSRALLNTTERR